MKLYSEGDLRELLVTAEVVRDFREARQWIEAAEQRVVDRAARNAKAQGREPRALLSGDRVVVALLGELQAGGEPPALQDFSAQFVEAEMRRRLRLASEGYGC